MVLDKERNGIPAFQVQRPERMRSLIGTLVQLMVSPEFAMMIAGLSGHSEAWMYGCIG
jgi:hypothetical protein